MAGVLNNMMAMTTKDFSAANSAEDRSRFLRYGVVAVVSAAMHIAIWQFRDALNWKPESPPRPVRIIEVSLAAVPKAKEPESPKSAETTRLAEMKPVVQPKPVAVVQPKVTPKPSTPPKPKLEPKQSVPLPIAKVNPPPPPKLKQEPKPTVPLAMARANPALREPWPTPERALAAAREAVPNTPPARSETAGTLSRTPSHASGESKTEEFAHATYQHSPEPAYPDVARRRGWEGRVVLRVRVLADGSCGHVEVRESSGHDILDEAAIESVGHWRFSPAKRGGQPVESEVNVPIKFSLKG